MASDGVHRYAQVKPKETVGKSKCEFDTAVTGDVMCSLAAAAVALPATATSNQEGRHNPKPAFQKWYFQKSTSAQEEADQLLARQFASFDASPPAALRLGLELLSCRVHLQAALAKS